MDYLNNIVLPEGYRIRHFTAGDFPGVEALWGATGLGGSVRGDNLQILQNTLDAGGHLLLVTTAEEMIVGTSWLTNDKRRTYLHHFGIAELHRRKGLAEALLKASLQLALSDGYQVKIEVHRENLPALSLYKKAGFGYLGDYDVFIIRDLDTINPLKTDL